MDKFESQEQIRKILEDRNKSDYLKTGDFEDKFSPEEYDLFMARSNRKYPIKYRRFSPSNKQTISCLKKAIMMADKGRNFYDESREFVQSASMQILKLEGLNVLFPDTRWNGGIHFITTNYDPLLRLTLCVYQVWNKRKVDISKCRMLDYQINEVGATKGCFITPSGLTQSAALMIKQNAARLFAIDNDCLIKKFRKFKMDLSF